MFCPVCKKEMVELDFGQAKVDVCKNGCKGIWFDWFELDKLDETQEGFSEALTQALGSPRINDGERRQLVCPKCNILMHIHKYQASYQVNVDECYKCSGFFLDSGELKVIRETFMSDEEKKEYTKSLLDKIPEYQVSKVALDQEKEGVESRKKKVRERAVRKLTKFIDPTYYMNLYGERE